MKDKEMKEPLTTEQIKEKYPVGSMVKIYKWTKRYGVVVGHSKNPILGELNVMDVMVHETTGEVRRWDYTNLKVVGKAIKKAERQ